MKKHIELLMAYADFEEQHPKAGLEDFYRYMLQTPKATDPKTLMPVESQNRLMRSIGRLYSSFNMYMRAALKELGMQIPEGYPFLATLHFMGPMRRTDLINFTLTELSTGSEILNRLKKQGWIAEQQDETDKRVKMVSISEKGRKILIPCLEKAGLIRAFMFKDLSEADRKTCATLLEPVEAIHAKTVLQLRYKTMEEIISQ